LKNRKNGWWSGSREGKYYSWVKNFLRQTSVILKSPSQKSGLKNVSPEVSICYKISVMIRLIIAARVVKIYRDKKTINYIFDVYRFLNENLWVLNWESKFHLLVRRSNSIHLDFSAKMFWRSTKVKNFLFFTFSTKYIFMILWENFFILPTHFISRCNLLPQY
jgi:hypothetical protein